MPRQIYGEPAPLPQQQQSTSCDASLTDINDYLTYATSILAELLVKKSTDKADTKFQTLLQQIQLKLARLPPA